MAIFSIGNFGFIRMRAAVLRVNSLCDGYDIHHSLRRIDRGQMDGANLARMAQPAACPPPRRTVPPAFANTVTPETYAKSVAYTLAKSRFEMFELTWGAVVLAAVSFQRRAAVVLPCLPTRRRLLHLGRRGFSAGGGDGACRHRICRLEWHAQFHLEERFGFNTTTAGHLVAGPVKGIAAGAGAGLSVAGLDFETGGLGRAGWWFWAWVCLAVFQLVMMLVAPVLIMPLFNKFTPLAAGRIARRPARAGRRAGFRARDIQVMDGSKRSRHSNAFFTGLGRFRKIVLV